MPGALKPEPPDTDLQGVMAIGAQRAVGAFQVATGIGLGAFALHTVLPDGGRLSHFFDYWVYYGIVVAAFALTALRALLVPLHRAGWTAMAVAVGSYTVAELIWLVALSELESPPYPSWADLFYLAFFPASYVGVVLLFRARIRGVGAALWIDGVTAALAMGAVGSAVLVDLVLESTEGPPSTVATNLAYPLGDVLLLALVAGAFALTRWQPGRAWLLIGAALAVFALGDSVYLFQVARDTYVEGSLVDASWPAALLLIAYAAWQDRGTPRTVEATGRALLALPAACAAVAVGVLVLDHFRPVNLLAIVLATLALAGVVARLGLTFRENGRLLALTLHEAVTDPLTGLGNRRRLVDELRDALTRAESDHPYLLALFDLDGFKGYNDAFGHLAGDELLTRLGVKLDALPGHDVTAYRMGGDEFCLLAPIAGVDVERLLDAAVTALSEHGEGFDVGCSFGAVHLPDEARDASSALRLADERLYAQKHLKQSRRDRSQELLLQVLHERDPDRRLETEAVPALALAVGRALGLDPSSLAELERAAKLHDLGMLAVPDAILRKPGPLDAAEWRFVRQHTVVGERILAVSPLLRGLGPIVRSTHERWDGSGYPDGLEGERIPLAARVIAVCDAFHAMTSKRPYREARSVDDALAELARCAGTQFDPRLATLLATHVRAAVAA
jgi:diguanylate cyclase (GGDEF)-like protein